ncbi:MAG: hypothetical protein ACI31S_00570 [Bacilli bacterium]
MNNEKEVNILYTNWRGITRWRKIIPLNIEFKATNWHKEKQWILNAIDTEKMRKEDLLLLILRNGK